MLKNDYTEKLAKVIYDSAKSKKEIDEEYLNNIVEPIINGESLNNYMSKVKIENDLEDAADYSIETGIVRLNLLETINDYKLEKNVFYEWKKTEQKLAKYSFVAGYVFHEIGHAYLLKKGIEGNENELEVQLLNLIYREDIQLKKAILEHRNPFIIAYLRLQGNRLASQEETNACDFALDERLAEIFSFELLLKIAEVLQVKNLQNYQKWQLYKAYLQGYKDSLFPTLHYLECIGKEERVSGINMADLNLDILTRMKYGLLITEEEHNKIKREKNRIKKTVR